MLSVKNVGKTYKKGNKVALKDVSIDIKEGEFVALLGQNGAGKSTLINIIAGNVVKDGGTVMVAGLDIDKDELKTKKTLGVVPQEINFDYILTVFEILENQSGYFGIKDNSEYIEEVLNRLNLQDKKHVNSRMLSGGMKRRLLIAKALIHKPKLLILDEPTAGVDIELRRSMYEFLNELHRNGTTIILTTHYIEEAEKLCDRIIIINQGELIADEDKEGLIKRLGNETHLELHFDRVINEEDFSFLSEYSPVQLDDTKLRLTFAKEDVADIFQKLKDRDINFSNFKMEHKKLEDVFLHLLKNGEEQYAK